MDPEAARDVEAPIQTLRSGAGVQLQEDLRAAGCLVIGPFSTLEAAMQAACREEFDVALLDINLKGRNRLSPG